MQVAQPVVNDTLLFNGIEQEVHCPSGKVVILRETNGADDEILSKLSNVQEMTNAFSLLANIITMDKELGKKPVVEDVMEYFTADRYYLIFKQRVLNHGYDLKFKHQCTTENCSNFKNHVVSDYEDNLKKYDGDLSDPNYKPTGPQPLRYPNGTEKEVEFKTSSQIQFKYKILNGVREMRQLDMPQGETTKNTKLVIRDLEVFKNGRWELVTYFGQFSSKIVSEIRGNVNVNDLNIIYDPIVFFKCPSCGTQYQHPLLGFPAFYFPEETT